MPIAGNPKKLAADIAEGFQQLNRSSLRQYTVEDLKTIIFNLNLILREIRAKQISLDDMEGLKEKNNKIRRINQAMTVIQSYSGLKGIKI